MTYVEDDNGATVTEECMYHCAPGAPAAFRAEYDRLAAEHARELDDRPADKLAAIAADMEREQYGSVRDLTAERFGPVDHELPAKDYPQQPVDALTSDVARIIAKNHSPYTGRPTSTDDVLHRYRHRLPTGEIVGADLRKDTGVIRNRGTS